MSNRIEPIPIPPLEKVPPIHPDGLPIDSKLTIQELAQTQKYVHSRDTIIFEQQLALDIIPNAPVFTRISSDEYSYNVAFVERDSTSIVERFTLLQLEYLDQDVSNTTTPNAMTQYDTSGNPLLINTIPPQGIREGYDIRVFSVSNSLNISLTDISNALSETTLEDISLIHAIELDEYNSSYPWTVDIQSGILVFTHNAPSLLTHNVYILFTRYIGKNQGGSRVFKATSNVSATELIQSKTKHAPETGDIYFNPLTSNFNHYEADTSSLEKWVPITLSRMSGQPPPLLDVSVNATTAYIEVRWRNPKQVATSMTSDIVYTSEDSPASNNNWLNQNIIYFPIVNRMIMKITSVDAENQPIANDDSQYIAYPMYLKDGNTMKSQMDTNGYVIFRKGSIISTADNDDSSRDTYESTDANNLLENMPQGVRIYKSVPTRTERANITVSNEVILPFSSTEVGSALNVDNGGLNRFRFDFWMENNSPDTQILPVTVFSEYLVAGPPEQPRSVELGLGQNNNTSVDTAVTQNVIEVVDPSFVSGTDNTQDEIVNFTEIHFEWSIDDFVDTSFAFSKIRAKDSVNDAKSADYTSSSDRTLTNGIMSLNRPVDNDTRFYTFDITSEFLGTDYNQIDLDNPVNLSVRVSYKNSSNSEFGGSLSSSIFFGIPSQHTIQNVKAGIYNSKNQFRITLDAFTDSQKIINAIEESTETVSTNTNYAVFIKKVEIRTEYEIDEGDIIKLSDTIFSYSKNSSPSQQNSTSVYFIDIPTGLPSGTFSNTDIKWRFQIRVRNNILNGYSEWSTMAGDATTIDDASVNAIQIQGINTNSNVNDNTITTITYQPDNDLEISWTHPNSNDRGIHDLTKTETSYPKVYNYDISFARKDVNTNRIEVGTNLTSTRTTDSANSVELSVFEMIDKNGVSTNGIGTGRTDTVKEIEVEVLQRNEFVSTYSRITRDFYYLLEDPANPTQHTAIHSLSTGSALNRLDIQWSKPSYQGFKTGLTNSPSNTTIEINQYRVNIEVDRENTDSPYYRHLFEENESLNDIIISASNRVSEARTTIVSGTNDLTRNSNIPTGFSGTKTNVLVYPETTYNITVTSRNIFNIEGDSSLNMTITTGTPSAIRSKLTSGTIPLNSTIDNLNNVVKYTNTGFILSETPSVGFQITNTNTLTSYSASQTHLMNGVKFNTFLGRYTYVTDVSDIKLRRFVLRNVPSNTEVYAYGSNVNQFVQDGASVAPIAGMFSITTIHNKDIYDPTNNRDGHNSGYWWEERFQWTMDFGTPPTTIFGVPILLEFQVRYNNQLTSGNYNSSSIEDGGQFDPVSRTILQNTANTNGYAYFDVLNTAPAIAKNGSTDYITLVSNNNKINGIPNLYPMGTVNGVSMVYEYKLNYELTNYSEYYGLNQDVDFTKHRLKSGATTIKDNIENRSWSTKTNCVRTLDRWTITELVVNQVDIGTSNSGEYKDARMYAVATNTHTNNKELQLQESNKLHRFIYDEATATTFATIFSSLRNVPDAFTPDYPGTTGETQYTDDTAFTAYGGDTTKNNQLSMWNGRFYSNQGWQTATEITTSNCVEYGIPNTLPVFTIDANYSWSIFKYQFINNTGSDFNPYKVMVFLGNNSNVSITDINNQDVKVFIHTGVPINDAFKSPYYWFTISKSSSFTDLNAIDGNITYGGNIGDTALSTINDTKFVNSSEFIGSGLFTGNFTRSFSTNRLIPGRVNQFTISSGDTQTFYVAIGMKNSLNDTNGKYISRPFVQLASGSSESDTKTFNAV